MIKITQLESILRESPNLTFKLKSDKVSDCCGEKVSLNPSPNGGYLCDKCGDICEPVEEITESHNEFWITQGVDYAARNFEKQEKNAKIEARKVINHLIKENKLTLEDASTIWNDALVQIEDELEKDSEEFDANDWKKAYSLLKKLVDIRENKKQEFKRYE